MKSVRIQAGKSKTIIQDISQKIKREYIVRSRAQLILILVGKRATGNSEISVRLNGKGAQAQIIGCITGHGDSVTMLHTLQSHEAPETTSNLLVKSILMDNASFLYDGSIRVDKKAQKTDAYQRNENLLLSDHAHAQSKPKLEILANDVRCTHGATVSTVSKDQLWYLATRGISLSTGTGLIAQGFLEHAISKISDTMTQQEVRNQLWQT